MKKLLVFIALFVGLKVFATQYKYAVPKDIVNTPIYGGLGTPRYSDSVVLVAPGFVDVMTVPLTGNDAGRMYRHICVFNPSATANVHVCFGTGCSSTEMSIPASTSGMGLCLDHTFFGADNQVTVIRAELSTAASVSPQIQIW